MQGYRRIAQALATSERDEAIRRLWPENIIAIQRRLSVLALRAVEIHQSTVNARPALDVIADLVRMRILSDPRWSDAQRGAVSSSLPAGCIRQSCTPPSAESGMPDLYSHLVRADINVWLQDP